VGGRRGCGTGGRLAAGFVVVKRVERGSRGCERVRETCATVAEHTRGAAANGAKRLIYVRF